MNISTLEKMARQALKGGSIAAESNMLLKNGSLTLVERNSLRTPHLQGAGNSAPAGSVVYSGPQTAWM